MATSMSRVFMSGLYSNPQRCCWKRGISFFRKSSEPQEADTVKKADVMKYDETVPPVPTKNYSPSDDVADTVTAIAADYIPTPSLDVEFKDNHVKCQILSRCMEKFNYYIPSSELGQLSTLSDVVQYYSIERAPKTAEERLKGSDLPQNVHLMLEPVRFTEETKDYFGGKTAFPERDTIVTSLKYRKIYKGYKPPKQYKEKDGFHYY